MNLESLISHYLFLLPLFISALGIVRVFRSIAFKRHGVITEAMITRKDLLGTPNGKAESFSISYEFLDQQENKITHNVHASGSVYHGVEAKAPVTILYDADRPNISFLMQKIQAELNSGIKLIILGIAIAAALYLI